LSARTLQQLISTWPWVVGLTAGTGSRDAVIAPVAIDGRFLGRAIVPRIGGTENPQSSTIFAAYGAAVKDYVSE
jgi:hypothetical protein